MIKFIYEMNKTALSYLMKALESLFSSKGEGSYKKSYNHGIQKYSRGD